VETIRLIMKASVRGRREWEMRAARPDDVGRAENRENLSKGTHCTCSFFQKSGRVDLRIDRIHIEPRIRRRKLRIRIVDMIF